MTNEELSKINLGYFKEYCESNRDVNPVFRQLHSNAIRARENFDKNYEIVPEAQELFITYFLQNLKGSGLSGF